MRNQLDDVASMTAALLRANPGLTQEVVAYLRRDDAARKIYLLVDGVLSQGEILTRLKAVNVKGASLGGVSRRMEILTDEYHVLAPDHRTAKGKVYRKTEIARALHIDRELKKLGIDEV